MDIAHRLAKCREDRRRSVEGGRRGPSPVTGMLQAGEHPHLILAAERAENYVRSTGIPSLR